MAITFYIKQNALTYSPERQCMRTLLRLITSGAESRWRCGKMQSSRLPTTRVPAGCWWETLTPKVTGGTLKQTGRVWGD